MIQQLLSNSRLSRNIERMKCCNTWWCGSGDDIVQVAEIREWVSVTTDM